MTGHSSIPSVLKCKSFWDSKFVLKYKSFCHTLKFLDFRMWLKLKIKQQFSHFRKHFNYREFSKNKYKKLVVFLNLNEVVCLHSCRFALFYWLWFDLNLNSWSLNSNQICWIFLQKEKNRKNLFGPNQQPGPFFFFLQPDPPPAFPWRASQELSIASI